MCIANSVIFKRADKGRIIAVCITDKGKKIAVCISSVVQIKAMCIAIAPESCGAKQEVCVLIHHNGNLGLQVAGIIDIVTTTII